MLKNPLHNDIIPPCNNSNHNGGGVCMKGGYYFRKDRSRWVVWFPFNGKRIIVNQYAGENIYHKKIAQKCLAVIQGDFEQYQKGLCPFRPEKYTGKGWTDALEYYQEFLCSCTAAPNCELCE